MIRAALAMLCIAALAGCGKPNEGKPAESTVFVGVDFKVERLFEVDGCTVYRFYDLSGHRYFTNCHGATQWSESCGKKCTRSVGVAGGGQ